MKCLDFYNSKELDDAVRSILDRSYEEWSDPFYLPSQYNMAKRRNMAETEQSSQTK